MKNNLQKEACIFSIIIPAFNEGARIKKTIEHIHKVLKGASYELLVIDDGSTDNTKEIVLHLKEIYTNTFCISLNQNKGKGFAIKTGFLHAKGKHILMIDADLSTPIETLFELEEDLQKYDILIGSRTLPSNKVVVHGPISRKIVRRASFFLRKLLFKINISDTQCGFKIFTNEAAKAIAQKMTMNRYGADLEKIIIAQKLGYKIKEIPVSWVFDEKNSKIHIFKDSYRTIKEWLRIKFNLYKGKY